MAIVLPAIIMLIGAVFLALAWGLIRERRKFADLPRIEVEAEVIRNDALHDTTDNKVTYAAVYRFTAPTGQTHEVTDPTTRDFALDEVGSHKLLSYPLGHPERAVPPGTESAAHWFAVALLLILGFGGVAGGYYAWLVGPEGW